jgi:hypothetical protein
MPAMVSTKLPLTGPLDDWKIRPRFLLRKDRRDRYGMAAAVGFCRRGRTTGLAAAGCGLDRQEDAHEDCREDLHIRSMLQVPMLHVVKQVTTVSLLFGQALLCAAPVAGPCADGGKTSGPEAHCCCAAAAAQETSCCSQPVQVRVCDCSPGRERPADSRQSRPDDLRLALRCALSAAVCGDGTVLDSFRLLADDGTSVLSSPQPRLQAVLCRWLT